MRLLKVLLIMAFDVETHPNGWDVRVWRAGRCYYRRKFTRSGIERRLGVYRLGSFEHAVEWWRGG